MATGIEVEGLAKRLGKKEALRGLTFEAATGKVVSLLGPNGAGKTTTVRILSTLIQPDSGNARICGQDVVQHAKAVRALIGLTGQYAAVDEIMSGAENLEMIGRLYRLSKSAARGRARELLDRLDLAKVADDQVRTYSGGMRRRLDLAASLVLRPRVLFLDEPTTGLDVRSRLDLWAEIESLVADGTTVLLTTQYLEEADRLADEVVVVESGQVIEQGTPAQLKRRVGGKRLEVALADPADLATALEISRPVAEGEPSSDPKTGHYVVALRGDDIDAVPRLLRDLESARIGVIDIGLREPTLDDVFLAMTGRAPGDGEQTPSDAAETSGTGA
ncbi:ATP-binding cassette domain-containing protein [Saccharopolyspora cebuensis]|uniref:ATP-binding cassette domain-containing protein n=1 Tax=Saccharopolyspora cebuensis TaxID=418759 RepID=UPI0031EEF419